MVRTASDADRRSKRSVLWVAEEATGQRGLQAMLATDGIEVVGVVTSTPAIAKLACDHGLPLFSSDVVRAAPPAVLPTFELLINVHSLYRLDAAWLARACIGAFNLHPGPLPECAGLNAPSWSIWNGATEHGVTLHWMEAAIDAGPIAFEHRFRLTPTDTGLAVATRCGKAGIALLGELAHAALADAIPRAPQDSARRRWFSAAPPRDGELDWTWPAEQLIRLWRACDYGPFGAPWGQPWFRNGDRRCHVRRLSMAPADSPVAGRPGVAIPVDTDLGATVQGAIEVGLGTGAVRIAEARCGPKWRPASAELDQFGSR